ncbi:MAG TPA: TonB-dependent receptor [Polyangia bacterium]|nr:TonB-dependent receptor [Polyangia bacterium]
MASFLFLALAAVAPLVTAQDFDRPRVAPAPTPVLTRPPALKKDANPRYPEEALAAGRSADVTLAIDLDTEGKVTAATVTESSDAAFDAVAVEAARAMEFSPAEIDGRPAAIRIAYVLHFRPPVVVEAPPPEPPEPPPPPPPEPTRVLMRGHLREKGTREPIVGASVQLLRTAAPGADAEPAEVVATTDAQGAFEVRADAPGGGRVVITEAAHQSCVRDLSRDEIHATAPATWDCFAAPADNDFETRVKASRPANAPARYTLSKPELTTVPGTYGDPLRVIQNLPGVARSPYGLGLLIVRGAPPTDSGTFVSGQAIPQPYHFLVGPSVLAPHLIERIDFYPGGFGVRYGRASGGVIDVVLKETPAPAHTWHGGGDVSVMDVSAYAEGSVRDGTSATLAVRRSSIDAVLPYVIPKRDGSTFRTVVPVYWDYQARVVQELASGARVGLMAFGSDDALKIVTQDPMAGDLSLDSHTGFHRVVAFWTTRLGQWMSRFSPAYGNGDESFTLGTGSAYIRYQRLFLRQDLSRPLGAHVDLRLGLDGLLSYDTAYFNSWYPREGRNFGTGALQQVEARRGLADWAPAAFVEAEWRPVPRLRITPGLRLDWYHVLDTDKISWDPRLNLRWEVTDRWVVKGGAGIYHQLPIGQFLDKEFGNPKLALIGSDQFSAGVERQVTPAFRVDAVAYYARRFNLPVPSAERFSSTGLGRSYGLELLLKHDVTEHFFGWVAYTLAWAEETAVTAAEMISGAAGDTTRTDGRAYRPTAFDQRHNLTAVASYRLRAWQFGARYRLVSGRPTSTITGSFYDADFGGYTPISTPASGRLPTFSQLDLRVERAFVFNLWTLSAYVDVQNVFNAQNPESYAYDYRFRESAPVRGLPILPVLGLKGRF